MAPVPNQGGSRRASGTEHEGFMRHKRFRWLKLALVLSVVVIAAYWMVDVQPRHNGGSWLGYTLGTLGVVLIVWLSLLGVRKRNFSSGRWSLKAWTSAHVYLGLSLTVIGTLHTGFQFGWNVHTLAYVLMMLVIVSGIWGITAYATLPASLSQNRSELTQGQMMEAIRALDRQLHDAAQPLGRVHADLVSAALREDPFAHGALSRLSGSYPRCATDLALRGCDARAARDDAALARVENLLLRRKAQLEQMRRHLRIKALLEVWLYLHVPATFALLAALTAHIVSVFYYW